MARFDPLQLRNLTSLKYAIQLFMKNQEVKKNPEFLEHVLKLNGDTELYEALQISLKQIDELNIAQLNRIGLKTYEKGKWTVHRILQHLIDWERIWCFRALLFARAEGSIPEAHDQEIMGKNSNADELSIEQLVNELRIVRQSTILMFESFDPEILETNCVFFEYEMPLYTIGLTIRAHQMHHFNILKERYLPLDKMDIEIRPLTKGLKEDYLSFFDHIIFKENPDRSICYCYDFHFIGDIATCTRESNRSAIINMIHENKLSGYLVYDNNQPIGWCNVNNRVNYQRLLKDYDLVDNADDKVCSVVCFLIHPDYRKLGLAQKILERIITDYSNQDYDYIEAYPKKGELSCESNFKGPLKIYEKYDFKINKEYDHYYVMRKKLN